MKNPPSQIRKNYNFFQFPIGSLSKKTIVLQIQVHMTRNPIHDDADLKYEVEFHLLMKCC